MEIDIHSLEFPCLRVRINLRQRHATSPGKASWKILKYEVLEGWRLRGPLGNFSGLLAMLLSGLMSVKFPQQLHLEIPFHFFEGFADRRTGRMEYPRAMRAAPASLSRLLDPN